MENPSFRTLFPQDNNALSLFHPIPFDTCICTCVINLFSNILFFPYIDIHIFVTQNLFNLNCLYLMIHSIVYSVLSTFSLFKQILLTMQNFSSPLLRSYPLYDPPQGRPVSSREISLIQNPDRKCEKVRALGTNKAACIPTHGGSHVYIDVVHIRNYTHQRRLPLTDPRIHEWSVDYQWAIRYPHALAEALSASLPPRRFLLFLLPFILP